MLMAYAIRANKTDRQNLSKGYRPPKWIEEKNGIKRKKAPHNNRKAMIKRWTISEICYKQTNRGRSEGVLKKASDLDNDSNFKRVSVS